MLTVYNLKMASKLIDILNHLLRYNDIEVYIAFNTKTSEPYFNAKQLCEMLEYVDYHDAIRGHVLKKDIYYLKDIVDNYKTYFYIKCLSTKLIKIEIY